MPQNELVLLRLRDPGRSALAKPTVAVLKLSHRTRYGDLADALERLAAAVRDGRVDARRYAMRKSTLPAWVVEGLWIQLSCGRKLDQSTISETGRPLT